MDEFLEQFGPFIFLAFMAYVIWSMFSKSGKGRMLGGKILESASNEIVQKNGMVTLTLRSHLIESSSGRRHIGLELSQNAKLGASMVPIKLSKAEAEKLIGMLREIAEKT